MTSAQALTASSSVVAVPRHLTALLPIIGVVVITLCAQIKIPLGFTPVPITGQTFAVILWGMLFGSRQGAWAAIAYVFAGAVGMPVFAGFEAFLGGPTTGFILGFIPSAWLAGYLAERGWTRNLAIGTLTGLVAHVPLLLTGGLVMSAFVGFQQTWALAIAPFIPGDVIKSVVAATMVVAAQKVRRGA
jgi:biotin transport system substrate-specific component